MTWLAKRLGSRRAHEHEQTEPGPTWVWPRRLDPSSGAVTLGETRLLGTTGSGPVAIIDDHGTVQLSATSWTVEWWVGAEDRWHRSGSEVNVRQQQSGSGPVTETAMRVPGGDIVQRAGACESDPAAVVLEFENRSAVPVALAVVVRPFELHRSGRIAELRVDGSSLWVDGNPGLVFDRMPASVVGGDAACDVSERLTDLASAEPGSFDQRCEDGMATVAMIMPLAHTAVARVAVGAVAPAVFANLPSLEQVSAGWSAHLDLGPRLEWPGASADFDKDLATLLVTAARVDRSPQGAEQWTPVEQARVLEALVRSGHPAGPDDLDAWLAHTAVRANDQAGAAAVIARAAADPHPEWFDEYLGWAVENVRRGVSGADDEALRSVGPLGVLLRRLDQPDSAEAVLSDWAPWSVPAWSSPGALTDPVAAAAAVVGAVDGLARAAADGLDLLSAADSTWFGQPVDIRELPTPYGPLSFSVRWHGDRPALLWERDPWPDAGDCRLRCSALDPSWSSVDEQGDALLGAPGSGGASAVEPGQSFG
ncbi:MAG: hypothetical protein ACR2QE_03580 [Acidimicrobiales bacterium]